MVYMDIYNIKLISFDKAHFINTYIEVNARKPRKWNPIYRAQWGAYLVGTFKFKISYRKVTSFQRATTRNARKTE